jgi:hypothetical protein
MGKAIGCGANKALKALGGAAVDATTGAGAQVVSNVLEGKPVGEGVAAAALDNAAGGVGLVAAVQSGCFLPGTSVTLGTGDHQAIETLRIGQRVLTPESVSSVEAGVGVPGLEGGPLSPLSGAVGSETKVDPTTWRSYKVSLRDALAESLELEVTLLRPVGWMAEHSRRVAGRREVWVDFEELNAQGWAEVIEERACPVIETGPGRVITATITRPNEDVRTLTLTSGETLHVTSNHRMFSATRQDWVPVKELEIGEALRTSKGRESVASLGFQRGRHQVYNLEVEDEHCYFVGSGEVLTHNSCVTGSDRNHVTYEGTKDGKPYVGYASAPSDLKLTPDQIVARRYNGDTSGFDGAGPTPVKGTFGSGVEGKAIARGMEQRIHEHNVKNSKNGVANAQNPVGQNNKHKAEYKKASAPAWKKLRRK